MNIKPILFNTEMVKAILDGRKTVTRRIANINQEISCHYGEHEFILDSFTGGQATGFVCRKCGFGVAPPHSRYPVGTSVFRPRYLPGDILYVRETWDNEPVTPGGHFRPSGVWYYKADGDMRPEAWRGNWHPSIHMPKEAARLFLRVKNVWVERLRDITIPGAISEGCEGARCDHPDPTPGIGCTDCCNTGWIESPIVDFAELWDSTIKPSEKAKCGWEANPWVWVNEFERCEKPAEVNCNG